jgi:hypothetical protein
MTLSSHFDFVLDNCLFPVGFLQWKQHHECKDLFPTVLIICPRSEDIDAKDYTMHLMCLKMKCNSYTIIIFEK